MAEKMSDGTIVIRLASLIRVLLNVCVTDAEVDQVMEQVHSRVALNLRGNDSYCLPPPQRAVLLSLLYALFFLVLGSWRRLASGLVCR